MQGLLYIKNSSKLISKLIWNVKILFKRERQKQFSIPVMNTSVEKFHVCIALALTGIGLQLDKLVVSVE